MDRTMNTTPIENEVEKSDFESESKLDSSMTSVESEIATADFEAEESFSQIGSKLDSFVDATPVESEVATSDTRDDESLLKMGPKTLGDRVHDQ